jgi:hypothetical protein
VKSVDHKPAQRADLVSAADCLDVPVLATQAIELRAGSGS